MIEKNADNSAVVHGWCLCDGFWPVSPFSPVPVTRAEPLLAVRALALM